MAVGKVDKKERLIRHQDGRRNRIPGGVTPEDFLDITRILTEIREDIDNELKALRASRGEQYKKDTDEPKELHIRPQRERQALSAAYLRGVGRV